jgi:hypothetical protein
MKCVKKNTKKYYYDKLYKHKHKKELNEFMKQNYTLN